MSSLQSRREFLGSTATTAVGLSLPNIPNLNKTDFLQTSLPNTNEDFGDRFLKFLAVSKEERRFNNPFKGLPIDTIRKKAESIHLKTIGNLAMNPNTTVDQARVKLREVYRALSSAIKNNTLDQEELFSDLTGDNDSQKYFERLGDILDKSAKFNHLIPDNYLSPEELTSFNNEITDFSTSLALKEDLPVKKCLELIEAFFKTRYRLNNRRELASRLATQAA